MKKLFVLLSSMICLLTASNADAYQQYSDQCVGQCTDPCVGQCEPSCGSFYAGAFGAANWLNVRHIEGVHKTKTGFAGGLSLGYKFDNGFRVEGEVSYRRNKVDTKHFDHDYYFSSFSDSSSSDDHKKSDGNLHSWSYMANFLYDFEDVACYWPNVVPYVGFGLGYTQAHAKINQHAENSHDKDKHDHKGFAYQAIAGIGYNLTESTTLAVEYRYFNGTKHINNNSIGLAVRQSF